MGRGRSRLKGKNRIRYAEEAVSFWLQLGQCLAS
jgi:hypothetical protein